MKRNNYLILAILILLESALFLAFLMQGREQRIYNASISIVASPVVEVSPKEDIPNDETVSEKETTPEAIAVGDVVSVENEISPPSFEISLRYDKYLPTYTYFLVQQEVKIYSGPSLTEKVIKKAYKNERLNYIETVLIKASETSIDKWYHVTWDNDGEPNFGFVKYGTVERRVFQFGKMEEALIKVQEYADRHKLTYINNYKNAKGAAPLYHGETKDASGNDRGSSAPGYQSLSNLAEFTYIKDGTLVRYLFSYGDFAKVFEISSGKTYFVPKKYIPGEELINVRKAIVIDRRYQNEAVYERKGDSWVMISYSLATTGTSGKYAEPTPLGCFYGIQKRSSFLYYRDGTNEFQGYAPYAIRFTAGAYIHGVPVDFKYNENGERITPPHREYSQTIGSVPLSHKCVRNYTSHAKFLYDWYTEGEVIVIVIE